MKEFDFNPFGLESIELSFKCTDCGTKIRSDLIYIPDPNYMAEKVRDSQVESGGSAYCDDCDKMYEIDIYVTMAGGSGVIHDLDQESNIDIDETAIIDEEEFDWLFGNETFYMRFNDELNAITELNDLQSDTPAIVRSIKRQLYIALITAFEAYLADAFIYHLFHNSGYVEKFVESYKGFKERRIRLSEIFKNYQEIDKICKNELRDIIWHNIPKVKAMYILTFDIDMGDISSLSKHVSNRHDLVHRGGATKDGDRIHINSDDISELAEEIKELVDRIDHELNQI